MMVFFCKSNAINMLLADSISIHKLRFFGQIEAAKAERIPDFRMFFFLPRHLHNQTPQQNTIDTSISYGQEASLSLLQCSRGNFFVPLKFEPKNIGKNPTFQGWQCWQSLRKKRNLGCNRWLDLLSVIDFDQSSWKFWTTERWRASLSYSLYPLDPKCPWKMKVLHPQNMG